MNGSFPFFFNADGEIICVLARSPQHLLEIFDVVVRLLAASVVQSVRLQPKRSSRDGALLPVAILAYLMEHCQSLKLLELRDLEMDKRHCRILGAYSRPDLKIELTDCAIASAGARALAEVLGRNQGPTTLHCCDIDNFVLADGLRGNSRLKSYIARLSINFEVANRQVLAIAGALKENKGLVNLEFRTGFVLMAFRTGLVYLHLLRGSITPYLEADMFRPAVHAIQQSRPMSYRAKVLGRALLAVRTDPNRFWMLLSGNPEVAFLLTTVTVTRDASTTGTSTSTTTNVAGNVEVAFLSTIASLRKYAC